MTGSTYSMAQLAQILSALEHQRRNPNSRQTAIRAIERNAAALGLSTAEIFAAADGLLDGRLAPEEWRSQLGARSPQVPACVPTAAETTVAVAVAPADAAEPPIDICDLHASDHPVARGNAASWPAGPKPDAPVAGPTASVRQQLLAACQAAEQWLLAERERSGEVQPDEILNLLRTAIERAESSRKPRPARPAGDPRSPRDLRAPRENSKEAQLIGLLRRPEGATIAQIATRLGWAGHTVRGAFAGALKKRRGLTVISEKPQGGERVYRLAD